MIYVGIDDTDSPAAPGTNQLVKGLAVELGPRYEPALIVRHQLLQDPRVPCTSKNSAASMLLTPQNDSAIDPLIDQVRAFLGKRFVEGSDPGLCVAVTVAEAIRAFAKRCQQQLVTQREARRLAGQCGVYLEGCGGTEDGVIGALAAVGLVADGNDGRIVQIGTWPDDLAGWQDIETLGTRGVEVRCLRTGAAVRTGMVDVGKRLRPNYRRDGIVLFARPAIGGTGVTPVAPQRDGSSCWSAARLP